MRAAILVGLLMLFVISGAISPINSYAKSLEKLNESFTIIREYTPHAPIHIVGDANFTSANGVVGGSGTPDDPYIIEGWEIDAEGGEYCIRIENTNAYFIIRNCRVYNASDPFGGSGIELICVQNGCIENNIICFNDEGIYIIDDSNYIFIKNNICIRNDDAGIRSYYSENVTIINKIRVLRDL